MKINVTLFYFLFFFANSFTAAKAQVNSKDSLALVDLYKSTNGDINISQFANGVYYIQHKTTGEVQKVVVVY